MHPVGHLAPNIHMVVNNCGCQLTEGWGGQHLPIIKRNVHPRIKELARLACSIIVDPMAAFGFSMVRGILVV